MFCLYRCPCIAYRVIDIKSFQDLPKQRITFTDKEIDALVYALYGLNEEEVKIVEGVEQSPKGLNINNPEWNSGKGRNKINHKPWKGLIK